MNLHNVQFFCSWSGGKDSCLSLYHAREQGGVPKRLVTMLVENGERSRSHGISLEVLKKQSECVGIPLNTYSTSWQDYERTFVSVLHELRQDGVTLGVFGDIDIENHRRWVSKVCSRADVSAHLPLWGKSRRDVVSEFLDSGFRALIVAVKDDERLGPELLGRELCTELVRQLEKTGVDPAGEKGEFHTLVIGGPIFTQDLPYRLGRRVLLDGYWFQDVEIK